MRILIVEDNHDVATWLLRALKQDGFVPDHAPNARVAEGFLASGTEYDAVVLDLGLPDKHGFAVLSSMRDRGDATPVLVLTAQGALIDRVRGLNLGADDFLVKPVAIEELEARLAALIRRSHGRKHPQLCCASLAYDSDSHAFMLGSTMLHFTPREHAALTALLMRAGTPMSKSHLYDKVFSHDSSAGPDAIELVLHRVRRKLNGSDVRIVTVRGLGYVLEAIPNAKITTPPAH
jgi:two-component system response regulator TctD